MPTHVWEKLGSREIIPSTITLQAYDGHPSQTQGLFQNVPLELGAKKVHIDIEFIDAPLDYNILLGHSYMYAMKVIGSSIVCLMMFPHKGKVVTIYQLNLYKSRSSEN